MSLVKVIRPKPLLLACIGFSIAFLFIELGLRLYLNATAHIEPVACKQEDPIVHHRYKPNATCRYKTAEWDTEIKINSHGLRNKEIEDKNKYRVLVIGDSFTAAESVDMEKTAVYLAEKALREEGKDIELINAGVPSYSPILQYLWLREYGLELDPDLVILNFDLGDISGDNFMSDYYLGNDLSEEIQPSKKPDDLKPDPITEQASETNSSSETKEETTKQTSDQDPNSETPFNQDLSLEKNKIQKKIGGTLVQYF